MKLKFISFIIIVAAIFISCEKESVEPSTETIQSTELRIISANPSILGPECTFPGTVRNFSVDGQNLTNLNWEVEGNASIVGGQGSTTVSVSFNNNWSGGFIELTARSNGRIYENRLQVFRCTDLDPCAGLWLGIPDNYIDGPLGGTNEVFLQASGNFPQGTLFSWIITREVGVDIYNSSTENPRRMVASFNNKIVRAKVTATFNNCTKTYTNTFREFIPNGSNPFGN